MLTYIANSLLLLFFGYIPAAILGVPIGIAIGINGIVYQIFKRLFQIPNYIFPIGFIVIGLLLFQNNERASIFTVFCSTIWTIIINTATGIQQFRQRENTLQVAVRNIFEALKTGVWVAWLAVILAEAFMAGSSGIGSFLWEAYQNNAVNDIITALITIVTVGFLLDQLVDLIGYFASLLVADRQKQD